MRPRLLLPLLALLVGTAAMTGCGSDDGGSLEGPAPGAPPSATPSTSPGGPVLSTTDPQLGDDLALPPDGKPVRATGDVAEGVEAGCLLMQVGGASYQLIGVPASVLGQLVQVTGRLAPDMLTTCQQGTPLRVESYEVLPLSKPPPLPSATP